MEDKHKVEKLFVDVKEYAETKLDLVALSIQDKGSDVLASGASILIITIVLLFVLLFASLGGAWLIGHCVHDLSIGFFSIAGFYLLVLLLVYFNRSKWIKLPMINGLLKKINFHEEN